MILTNRSALQEPLLNKSSRKHKVILFMSCLVLMLVVIAYFNSHDEKVLHQNEIVVLASDNDDEIINELNQIIKKFGEVSTFTKVTQTITDVFSFAGYIGDAFSTLLSAYHFFTDYQNDRYIKAIQELTNLIEENQRETMDALGELQMTVWKAQMAEPYTIMKDLHIQLQTILATGEVDKCSIQNACGVDFSRCRTAFNTMNTVAQAQIIDVQSNTAYDYNYGNFLGKLQTEKSRNLLEPIMYTIMQGYVDISQAQAYLTHPYNESSSKEQCNSTISEASMKQSLFTFQVFMNQTFLSYQTLAYKMRSFEYQAVYVDKNFRTTSANTRTVENNYQELQYITGIYIGGWWVDNIDGFIISVAPDEGYLWHEPGGSERNGEVSTTHTYDSVPGTGSCFGLKSTNYSWLLTGLELEPYSGWFNYGIWYLDKLFCRKMRTQNGSQCRSQRVNADPGNWIHCSEPGEYIGSITRSYDKQGLDSIGEIGCCRPTFSYTPIEVREKP